MKQVHEALINGEWRKLTESETTAEANFHLNRVPFAWLNNHLVIMENPDTRDHQHWLCEDYHLSESEFEQTRRGYIMQGKIQFFIGSGFRPMDLSTNPIEILDLDELLSIHNRLFSPGVVKLYNGVHIGKIGDVWPPIEEFGEVDCTPKDE